MLRIHPIANAAAAKAYYAKSDGNYYIGENDLRKEWGGKGAILLGMFDKPEKEQFDRLVDGLHPETGEQLTIGKRRDDSLAGWDINVHSPKGVTTALELGDTRIQDALWDAGRKAMVDIEEHAATRVRKGGTHDDRETGNIVWYGVEHAETRPAKDDGMPDWHRHIHFVVANATFDAVEGEWKALKVREIMELRKYFDRRFDMYMAKNLADLGYEVESKWKRDDKGNQKYAGWDIKGIPQSVIDKFSRRTHEVEQLVEELGIKSEVAKDKIGATSRQRKGEMGLVDYRTYWQGRITDDEGRNIAETIKRAMLRQNKPVEVMLDKAVSYTLSHHFERESVVDTRRLAITAMERSMGSALPDQVMPEAKRQGLIVKEGLGTTAEVLAEESRMIAFAVRGKGTMRPMSLGSESRTNSTLSAEQQAAIEHFMTSRDQVMILRGNAGTGKTRLTREAVARIEAAGKRVAMVAPLTQQVKGLHRDGFNDARTLASFMDDEQMHRQVRNGVIFLEEAGLVGSKTMASLFELADQLSARVILSGDKKQLASVERGAALRVLEDVAGLPIAELREIRRQQHDGYKEAIKLQAEGFTVEAFDKLDAMGSVKLMPVWDKYEGVAKDYVEKLEAEKDKTHAALIVCPTHSEGDKVQAEVRHLLRKKGIIKGEDRVFTQMKPLQWTDAERSDLSRYDGSEVVEFREPFKATRRVVAANALEKIATVDPKHFAPYRLARIGIAANDQLRITANGKTKDGRALSRGDVVTVKGFDKDGNIVDHRDWVIPKEFGHIAHNYVNTVYAAQGRTVKHVIGVASAESLPALNRESFHVTASRGRQTFNLYTDSKQDLRQAVQRSNPRISATELLAKAPMRTKWRQTLARRRNARSLHAAIEAAYEKKAKQQRKELTNER